MAGQRKSDVLDIIQIMMSEVALKPHSASEFCEQIPEGSVKGTHNTLLRHVYRGLKIQSLQLGQSQVGS